MDYSSGRHSDYAQSDVLIPARSFEGAPFTINLPSLKAVANGGTADILVGTMVDNHESWAVAVKVFKTVLSDAEKMLLVRELEIARQVSRRHHFITPFIGTADIGRETSIVSLYMENGNLMDYLNKNQDADRKKLLLQVANAVVFLHSSEGLVHGDLKCANVLISDFGNALLADFGLSTFIEKAESTATTATDARTKYTLRFAAPELLLDSAGHSRRRSKTRETDVYAFGMLVLEALTEQSPWFGLTDMAVLLCVYKGAIPSQPRSDGPFAAISHAWWDVLKRCWSYTPSDRPTIEEVLDDLTLHSHLPCRVIDPPQEPTVDEMLENLGGLRAVEDDLGDDGSGTHFTAAAYFPCGQRLALTTASGAPSLLSMIEVAGLCIYDIASGKTMAGPSLGLLGYASCLAVSPDGMKIASADFHLYRHRPGYAIHWWDLTLDSPYREPEPETFDIISGRDAIYALSPNANWMVTCTGNRICLWDVTNGKHIVDLLSGPEVHLRSVSFSADIAQIISVSDDNELSLWDILAGESVAAWTSLDDVSCVCLLPNGNTVTGSDRGEILVWSAVKLERTLTHPTHAGIWGNGISSIVVSPSGRYVASISLSGIFQLWDTKTWEPVGMPKTVPEGGDAYGKTFVAFSPNGKSLISLSDGILKIWDLVE